GRAISNRRRRRLFTAPSPTTDLSASIWRSPTRRSSSRICCRLSSASFSASERRAFLLGLTSAIGGNHGNDTAWQVRPQGLAHLPGNDDLWLAQLARLGTRR